MACRGFLFGSCSGWCPGYKIDRACGSPPCNPFPCDVRHMAKRVRFRRPPGPGSGGRRGVPGAGVVEQRTPPTQPNPLPRSGPVPGSSPVAPRPRVPGSRRPRQPGRATGSGHNPTNREPGRGGVPPGWGASCIFTKPTAFFHQNNTGNTHPESFCRPDCGVPKERGEKRGKPPPHS